MSFNRLIASIDQLDNPTVAGLDAKLEYIPQHLIARAFSQYGQTLEGAAEAIYLFNQGLIDALCDVVPAVKPQCAFYEMYGWPGVRTLVKTIEYAQSKGMFVITDGKRGDIGSTMEAYASGHLGKVAIGNQSVVPFGADALTVNGYLGSDGIRPLLKVCEQEDRGIFVLVKTSNPSSGELQDRLIDGQPVYDHMGAFCQRWGESQRGAYEYSSVGAVVGATYPEQLAHLRKTLPNTFLLVPGYGAQGGGAQQVRGAFDKEGRGAVVNSSRAIMCAWKNEGTTGEDYAQAARAEAVRMREDIRSVLAGGR